MIILQKKIFSSSIQNINNWRLRDPEILVEYWNNMHDVYKNVEESNPGRKHKV